MSNDCLAMAGAALDFLNATNTGLIDIDRPKRRVGKPKKLRRAKKGVQWKVLAYKPSGSKRMEPLERAGTSSQDRRESRYHMCRGHFKTYTKDAPLLGKHVGKFWWAHHARGSRRGAIVQDRRIED